MRYSNGVHIAARCVFLFLFAAAASSALVQTAAALPGDVDGSGVINQVDAALIKDHLLQRTPLTGEALARADANQDGSLDLEDVVWVAKNPTPPQLAPNVFVVDGTPGLEALDWTPPTLLLRWSGAGAHGIDPGDYVVGSAFNGFLRRVASIAQNGSILTIQTTQATLADILLQGRSTGQMARLGPPRLASSAVRAAGVSKASADWDRVEWDLSGKVLYQDDLVTIDLPTAVFAFDPMIQVDWALEGAQLKYFRAEAGGDFSIDLTARINAQIENEWDKEIPIPGTQFQQVYVQWTPTLPPLPIVEVVTFELVAKAHLEGNAFATVEPGFSYTVPVRVGAEYTAYNDTWREIRPPLVAQAVGRLDWQAGGDVAARVTVAPTVSVELYGIAGPNFDIEPYLSFDAQVRLNPPSGTYQLDGGVDAVLGFYFGIFDTTFIDHEFPAWNLYNKTLLSGEYAPPAQGTIAIDVTPNSGSWTLTGPAGFSTVAGSGDRAGGSAITGAPAGSYTLTCNNNVSGYSPPAPVTRALAAGGALQFVPAYSPIPQSGVIEITAFPKVGSWTLTGPAGFTPLAGSGDRKGAAALRSAPLGNYTLTCNDNVSGYNPPAAQTKALAAGQTLAFTAAWTPEGGGPGTIEMVSVPAGTFTMGRRDDGDDGTYGYSDELPRHQVTLSAYQIGKYEVTNGQYCGVLNWALGRGYLKNSTGGAYTGGDVYASGGYRLLVISDSYCQIRYSGGTFTWKSRTGSGGVTFSMESHPVVDVTWYGTVAFCNWLSEKEGLTPCYNLSTWALTVPYPNGYRLPTEAEWERAAAWDGSKHWIYGFLSDTLTGKDRCNYEDYYGSGAHVNPLGLTTYPYTSLVGWFNGTNVSPNGSVQTVNSPSPVGAYDMSGNVWEWCHDWYNSSYYSGGAMTNPRGPGSGSYRVLRGGVWDDYFRSCRSAVRSCNFPDGWYLTIGFRLVRTP